MVYVLTLPFGATTYTSTLLIPCFNGTIPSPMILASGSSGMAVMFIESVSYGTARL